MGSSKKKKTSSAELEESLRKHGEAFMRMFDDGDEDRGPLRTGTSDADGGVDDMPGRASGAGTHDPPAGAAPKNKKKKKERRHEEDTERIECVPLKPKARDVDDLDAIFGAINGAKAVDQGEEDMSHQRGEGNKMRKTAGEIRKNQSHAADSNGRQDVDEALLREEERLRRKIQRKRFMSSNPDSMLSFDEESMLAEAKRRMTQAQPGGRMDKKAEMEEFKAIRREIQSFGATGLDRKTRAKFEQDRLLELGARKEKGVRMPARIGLGIAKKAAWREQRSIDEAIASGMVSRKAIAEKKRRALKQERSKQDRGLWEDGGNFNAKRGVLRVRK